MDRSGDLIGHPGRRGRAGRTGAHRHPPSAPPLQTHLIAVMGSCGFVACDGPDAARVTGAAVWTGARGIAPAGLMLDRPEDLGRFDVQFLFAYMAARPHVSVVLSVCAADGTAFAGAAEGRPVWSSHNRLGASLIAAINGTMAALAARPAAHPAPSFAGILWPGPPTREAPRPALAAVLAAADRQIAEAGSAVPWIVSVPAPAPPPALPSALPRAAVGGARVRGGGDLSRATPPRAV
ncbi:hypothetical protein ATO13_16304 [Stappia sp. 22II-S9-Z10]|nr:hypothetical protein ATO13_16304 [Stappia sp. 22II-S9-Z10]